jgi:dihydroflavonol-4-reductase
MISLVTGATGFSGSHLVRHLLARGDRVRALVRPESREAAATLGEVEVVLGDVRDAESVERAVRGADRVFHLAALFRQAGFADAVYEQVNVGGTRHVLEAAKRHAVPRVVHCSTVGVLGHIENPPADESSPYAPGDVYQRTKLAGELLALDFGRTTGLPVAVVRPAMIWGEGDRRMLKLFRGIARKRFPIVGDGRTMFHFVHIDDLCRGFLLAAESERAVGERYIFAGATPVRLEDLAGRIAGELGVPPPRLRIPAWPVQALGSLVESVCVPLGIEPPIYRRRVDFFTKHRWFSIEKAHRELGYEPAQTLDEEIRRISSDYRERGWL